jgi:translation elongation factor EF-G
VIGGINQRRGTIVDTEVRDDEFTAICEVSLNDMFGYASNLRGITQGKGEFSMEYKVFIIYEHTFSGLLTIAPEDPSTCATEHTEGNDRRVQKEATGEA